MNPGRSGTTRRPPLASPALAWARTPAAARSFVILMDDQAGRVGLGVNHWVAAKQALKGGKTLGAAILALRFHH